MAGSDHGFQVEETILSDSDEELQNPTSDSGGTLSASRARRKRTRTDYSIYYDSDAEKDEVKNKRAALSHESKEIVNLEYFLQKLERAEPKSKVVKRCKNLYFHDYQTKTDSLVSLLKTCGKYIKRLSFGTVSNELLRHVGEQCPGLESLTLRSSIQNNKYPYMMQVGSSTFSRRKSHNLFSKLPNLHLETNNFLCNKEDFTNLLKSCTHLESFFYSFTTLPELAQVLVIIHENLRMGSLKTLTFSFGKEDEEEEVVLHHNQIELISNLSEKATTLEKLEIVAGLWEDVTAQDIERLLNCFSATLQQFTIAGNLQGIDLHDRQLTINVPKLTKLIHFSMGSEYEFEVMVQAPFTGAPGGSGINPSSNGFISLTEKHLISLVVKFPHIMVNLESICLGNLVEIDKIHPKTFPRLQVLRIGSAWNNSIDLPPDESQTRRFPIFPFVRMLQLPDCMKDEYFVKKTRQLFPTVQKVWMSLPSVRCLRHFFHAMSDSQISELHLKTQYDFKGVLESALLAKPTQAGNRRRPIPSTSSAEGELRWQGNPALRQLLKLKNPEDGDKVYNEFIRYHNLELPISDDDPILETSTGVGSLTSLRILRLEHIPRRLRIPTNNTLPHYHHRQEFHPTLSIGFAKYPLSNKFFEEEFQQLINLEKFRCGNNIARRDFILPSMCSFSGNSSRNPHGDSSGEEGWDEELASNFDDAKRKKLKVKILPSTLANDQFKVKPEKIEEEAENFVSQETASDVKFEVKIEED